MEFLKKVQNLPLKQRKIILWIIVVILGLALCVLWLKITKERIKSFGKGDIMKEFNLPDFNKESLEIPEFGNEEEPKNLEELIKEEAEKQGAELNNE